MPSRAGEHQGTGDTPAEGPSDSKATAASGADPPPAAPERQGDGAPAGAAAPDGEDKSRAKRMAEQLGERRERHRQRGTLYRVAITAAGFLLVLAGIVLSGPGVPGPGFLVILVGLALLALEFAWAERLLRRGLDYADRAGARASRMSTRRKVVIGLLAAATVAAAVAAVFIFDIPVPLLND